MAKIFLSHSSLDNTKAVALRDWLAREGWDDVFLDLDSDRGIAAGERWERALHEATNRCEAVIFLVSANWLASGWCMREHTLARQLNKKLFAVVIDPGKSIAVLPPELKDTWQAVDLTSGQDGLLLSTKLPGSNDQTHVVFSRDGLRRLKRGLDKAGLDPKFFPWPPEGVRERAPYRGLKPLEDADAGIFFGRDATIIEAIDRLRGLKSGAAPRLLVILGASGAGKSSFLRAGLLPRLARDDRNFLPLAVIRPESAALTGEYGLLRAVERALPNQSRADVRKAIDAGASGLQRLFAKLAAGVPLEHGAKPPAIVLAIDQAEEMFRPEGAAEGTAMLELVRVLTRDDAPAVIVLFAIRSDSYDALECAKPLEGLPQNTLALLPMPGGAYKDVIEGPARRFSDAGGALTIEPQLTQRLLEDIDKGGGSDALPLLAFTLEQLFLDYSRSGALRLQNYEDFGGLKGTIDAAVERAFQRADADRRIPRERKEREALLRLGLIPWLAGIDPDSRASRRNIARRSDVPGAAAPLIDLLVEERLLSTDTVVSKDSETGGESRVVTIEPAHEALLRQWRLLQGWLEEDFGLLVLLEGIKRAARDWDANRRGEAWLVHRGQRLYESRALDARLDIVAKLDSIDRAYLSENEVAAAREEQTKREADENLANASSTALSALSQATLQSDPTRAVKLALAAWPRSRQDKTPRLEVTIAALGAAVPQLRERTISLSHENAVSSAAFSPDGTRVLSVSGTARLWDAANGAPGAVLHGHEKAVSSAAFLPDGRRVVTASSDNTARLWDAATGAEIAVLRHDGAVSSASASPDGTRIITASSDRSVRLWDAATGAAIAVLRGYAWDATTGEGIAFLRGQDITFQGAAFSPDGTRVVASGNMTARLWDVATGAEIAVLRHGAPISIAAFSPDGTKVVTASTLGSLRLWNAGSDVPIVDMPGHESSVTSAAFSPEGTRVVTASNDETARLWDAATGAPIAILRGHEGGVSSACFSPDGARVITASDDKTARLWDAATGAPIAILRGHGLAVRKAAFSSDGRRLVTASSDKTARLWDAAAGQEIAVVRYGSSAAFSPDGTRFVTASNEKPPARWGAVREPDIAVARLWDAATGREIAILLGHGREIRHSAFSPDGARVLTASSEKPAGLRGATDDQDIAVARLWDAASGGEIAVLRAQGPEVRHSAFSPDGTRVVTVSVDRTARVWEVATGQEISVLRHENGISSAAFSPDGARVVTASRDTTARVWDAATGGLLGTMYGHEDDVWNAGFSPDGTRVVTGSKDKTARLWDATTSQEIAVLRGHEREIRNADFSPDGRRVVTASLDKTARLWDAATGTSIAVLSGHEDGVWSAVFSPDGSRVATASMDMSLRLWDAATGASIVVMRGHEGTVWSAVFLAGGKRVATTSADNTARIWDISRIPGGNIFQVACAWLPNHDLTDIAHDYGLTDLKPICQGDPPMPD